MPAAAGELRGPAFLDDKARRLSFDELYHLTAAELVSDDDLLGRINSVNLKYVLGKIQRDRSNLQIDGPLI